MKIDIRLSETIRISGVPDYKIIKPGTAQNCEGGRREMYLQSCNLNFNNFFNMGLIAIISSSLKLRIAIVISWTENITR